MPKTRNCPKAAFEVLGEASARQHDCAAMRSRQVETVPPKKLSLFVSAVDRELSPDLKLQDRVDEVVVGRVAHVPALVAHADLSVADLAHRSGDARPSARINARGTRTIGRAVGAGLGDEPAVCVLFKVKAFVSLRPGRSRSPPTPSRRGRTGFPSTKRSPRPPCQVRDDMTQPEAFAPDPLPSLVRASSDSEAVMTEPSSVTQASDSFQFVTD